MLPVLRCKVNVLVWNTKLSSDKSTYGLGHPVVLGTLDSHFLGDTSYAVSTADPSEFGLVGSDPPRRA